MANQTRKSKGVGSKIIIFLCAVVAIVCLAIIGLFGWGYVSGAKNVEELSDYTSFDDVSDLSVDWDSLKEINPDIVGWIYMPDTEISNPICWREGDDEYYLYHDFNGQSSDGMGPEFGTIFLSGENASDFSSNSNFLFGHNMIYTGKMFTAFSDNQGDSVWFNNHRTIYVLTPSGSYELETFAQIKVPGSSTDIVYTSFGSQEQLSEYLNRILSQNLVETGDFFDVDSVDRIFAFSTCSKPDTDNRIITYATVKSYL